MNSQPIVSIIICTRNRAVHLEPTLRALGRVCVPPDLPSELIIADNASTDGTADLVRGFALPNMELRTIHEARAGKGWAYNAGMAAARGKVILFTDDDVLVPLDWIEGMSRPILCGEADAIVGRVAIAPHLLRPWMEEVHRIALASTELSSQRYPGEMVGANMAISTQVLAKVPGFDVELGPGALGFADDSLFSMQIKRAGFRVIVGSVAVEHHFDESRLLRSQFGRNSQMSGRSRAYIDHHWFHKTVPLPRLRLMWHTLNLAWLRWIHRREPRGREGMAPWEMALLHHIAHARQYLIESRRPRHYEKQGLTKLTPHV